MPLSAPAALTLTTAALAVAPAALAVAAAAVDPGGEHPHRTDQGTR